MEQNRIDTLSDSLRQYVGMLDMTAPKLQTVCQELSEVMTRISPQSDIESTCNRVGMGEYVPEQALYYGYENLEDTGLKPETRRYVSSRPSGNAFFSRKDTLWKGIGWVAKLITLRTKDASLLMGLLLVFL